MTIRMPVRPRWDLRFTGSMLTIPKGKSRSLLLLLPGDVNDYFRVHSREEMLKARKFFQSKISKR
jgi:hypothetical protein